MRVLILGGGGMLGNRLSLAWRPSFTVWATYRTNISAYRQYELLPPAYQIGNIDAERPESVEKAIKKVNPDVVINCIGLVKQRDHGQRQTLAAVNSLFPHLLASYCEKHGCRLIHISTDCVYSGGRGFYTEEDVPDPVDEYGMSKLLGEPVLSNALTLRTSLIGWELNHFTSLLEWFAAQRNCTIKGYKKAVFSGFTTQAIAALLSEIILNKPTLSGLYHLSCEPINKYDLLKSCIEEFGWRDIELVQDDNFMIDRSLDGSRLNSVMQWDVPSWKTMIADLHQDWAWYKKFRQG